MARRRASSAGSNRVLSPLAGTYAQQVDARPMNAPYERPAMRALMPDVAGKQVLDIGCGSGWYAAYLLSRGAEVTAFDYDAQFVALTQARVRERALVLRADRAEPLRQTCHLQLGGVKRR